MCKLFNILFCSSNKALILCRTQNKPLDSRDRRVGRYFMTKFFGKWDSASGRPFVDSCTNFIRDPFLSSIEQYSVVIVLVACRLWFGKKITHELWIFYQLGSDLGRSTLLGTRLNGTFRSPWIRIRACTCSNRSDSIRPPCFRSSISCLKYKINFFSTLAFLFFHSRRNSYFVRQRQAKKPKLLL